METKQTKQTLNLSTVQDCLDDIMNEIIEGNEVNVNIDYQGYAF